MPWRLHEPGEPVELEPGAGEVVWHVEVYWPEYTEPLHAEIAAPDAAAAVELAAETFSRIPGRGPIERVDAFTLEAWIRR